MNLRFHSGFRRASSSAFILLLLFSPALFAQDAWYGGGGYDGYELNSARPAIGCPQANNAEGATNITASGAWLNGMLLATGGAPATVYVYWGTMDGRTNKGSWDTWADFGACAEWQALTTNVGVNSNTTYYYRFYATNAAGDDGWASASASFLSDGAPALNAGTGAAPVSYTTATLHGNLVAGLSAVVSVFWGQNTNAWAGTNSLGTRVRGLFNTTVTGLNSGTLYYYRCYGTNAYGEGWSDILPFTTRVEMIAISRGGSYDGYDRYQAQTPLLGSGVGTLFIFF